jgi:hypothetical protein
MIIARSFLKRTFIVAYKISGAVFSLPKGVFEIINETMTVQERMQAALKLEPVDRHPVYPMLFPAAARPPQPCVITWGPMPGH